MDNTDITYKKENKKGGYTFIIDWPSREFTAEEVYNALQNQLSRVSIHKKLNEAVSSGKIEVVGQARSKNSGRPRVIYKTITSKCLTELGGENTPSR